MEKLEVKRGEAEASPLMEIMLLSESFFAENGQETPPPVFA